MLSLCPEDMKSLVGRGLVLLLPLVVAGGFAGRSRGSRGVLFMCGMVSQIMPHGLEEALVLVRIRVFGVRAARQKPAC